MMHWLTDGLDMCRREEEGDKNRHRVEVKI